VEKRRGGKRKGRKFYGGFLNRGCKRRGDLENKGGVSASLEDERTSMGKKG